MNEVKPKLVVNPTPRQVLLNDKTLHSMHRDLMQNPALTRSIELAQAHYSRILAERGALDGYSAASSFHKITGVVEFIAILKSLGETGEIPKITNTDKINHNA
jgi:hypothetical protein